MERESSVECSVFLMRTKEFKAVGYEIVLREIQRCFLHGAAKVFSLYGQENYVLQIAYVGIYVSQTFYKFCHPRKRKRITKCQGHPTSIFGKYLFRRRFEI